MSALELAMFYWESGYRLPVDIAARLLEEGLDVEALESKHLK